MTEKELPKGKGRRPKLMGISESNAALRVAGNQPYRAKHSTLLLYKKKRFLGELLNDTYRKNILH